MIDLISMEKESYNFSIQLNNLYSIIYKNLDILKEENQKLILYGDGNISKIVQNYIPNNIVSVVDINSKKNHPSNIIKLNYDKIIITVFGRELEILDYLINTLKIKEDKIFLLSPYLQDIYINNNKPLILIYQMGKVGSSSIYHSLLNSFNNRQVFQIHYIYDAYQNMNNNINTKELTHPRLKLSNKNLTENTLKILNHHYYLGNKLFHAIKNNPQNNYKIITGIREPISQLLSNCFQGIKDFDFIDKKGILKKRKIIKILLESINENYYKQYYDRELKTIFGIDIFSYKFDTSKPYFYIKEKNIEIIIYKLESLNSSYEQIFQQLFPYEHIKLIKKNEAKNKSHYKEYKEIEKELSFDEEVLRKFYYQKDFIQNFYEKKEIENFINKWKT